MQYLDILIQSPEKIFCILPTGRSTQDTLEEICAQRLVPSVVGAGFHLAAYSVSVSPGSPERLLWPLPLSSDKVKER
jgi:hypothetical protein